EVGSDELVSRARAIARGLVALGVERGDRISILSDTRPEWTLADAGAFCAGAVVAPIYQTSSPEECEYVLAHSEARVVLCEDEAQVQKILAVRERCPQLEHVIAFDGAGAGWTSLDDLVAAGRELADDAVDQRAGVVQAGDLATLVYTSGTTGPPKACMLTHDNFMAATHALEERLDLVRAAEPIELFLFLPLAHVFARITQVFTLDLGGTLIYWQRDPLKLLEDIRESRPTYFPSVPRVWEKIHTAATSGIADQPALKRAIFHWSLGVGRRARERERAGERVGALLARRRALADKLVLSKVRDLFGGRLVLAVTAAAPIAPEVIEFFDSCGIDVLEAWGMTETCAAGAINTDREMKFGTVGKPVPGLEMRVAADGELLARGPNIFTGYFKNEEATRETLPDGWLATGDLGEIDEDGFVRITGRKKDLIITSSGKNITPANLENALKQSRWISEAIVFGDRRPYLVALLTLDGEEAPKLAEQLGVEPDLATMAHDPRVREEIQKAVDAANARFARIEQIKRFAILDRELTQADGELTPTLKVKRANIYGEFADVFDGLYAG
ncbi:MAG TPA: long-chain fatty acid--CoA ligase, partial [Solirubrobacteraceae bacterium]|nr:long-chain fatty acid--CoA ligase [Solirubrobacteraceae bacterium]